ncbi:MAG TPA: hypothetical protein PKV71_17695, partial [Calditrichia bacterium]|nr:hypothetical protein [Calditrichia bacterium]
VTDDSHNPRAWNSLPPYDPDFWGLTLYVNDPDQRGNVSLFDYQDVPSKNVIVDLTRMRDDEHASKSFSLSQDMNVRIYALGEGDHGEMYDYGWLVNGDTRERVWEMKYRDTEHAGGNSKNRLIDEVISLPKGNYTAYYVTDGSHSYRDWNASPPFDQQNWGLTILAADDGFKPSFVGNFQPNAAKNVIAHITEVRDWETRKVQFEIEKDGEVRIYALGEGSDGEMFDYGWIEDSSNGKVVWEMTYRRTEHAGGARKNRLFNDLVYLRKGRYVLYFESDDSHSYGDWNSSPPRDPENWGITIFKVDK